MNEKFLAGALTAIVVAPLCSLCILGPAVLAAFFGGLVGWFSDLNTVLVAVIFATLAGGYFTIRNVRSSNKSGQRSES